MVVSLIGALFSEFSMRKASQVGLNYDFHQKALISFEVCLTVVFSFKCFWRILLNVQEHSLRPMFEMILSVLQDSMQNVAEGNQLKMMHSCLTSVEFVLTWEFSWQFDAINSSFKLANRCWEAFQSPDFPTSWRSVLLNPGLLDLFFSVINCLISWWWELPQHPIHDGKV